MSCTEEIACFGRSGNVMLGILALPRAPTQSGVVLLVGGPQYRVGSQRQWVLLARAVADAGHAVLRFDFCGMGDSEGQPTNFDARHTDIAAAIDYLVRRLPGVQHLALWGLCDGAAAALLYCAACPDARVSALCLANPWVRSAHSLVRTQVRHYYLGRLRQRSFWAKLLRGGVPATALWEWVTKLAQAWRAAPPQAEPYPQRMARAWHAFAGPILLLLSEKDLVAREFLDHARHDAAWAGALQHPRLRCHTLPGADHCFSSAALRAQVVALTLRDGLPPVPTAAPNGPADAAATAAAHPAPHTVAGSPA